MRKIKWKHSFLKENKMSILLFNEMYDQNIKKMVKFFRPLFYLFVYVLTRELYELKKCLMIRSNEHSLFHVSEGKISWIRIKRKKEKETRH